MRRLVLPFLAVCAAPAPAFAQAWVSTAHSLSADVGYTYAFSKHHVYEDRFKQFGAAFCAAQDVDIGESNKTPDGGLTSHILNIGIDYTPPLIDGLGLQLNLPIVTSKYSLDNECDGRGHQQTPGYYLDDGEAHTALSDIHGELRYMIPFIRDYIAVTPLFGFNVPTWDYPTLGHASVGRGLWELQFGLNVGWSLSSVMDSDWAGLYLHARYAFGLAQSPKRSPRAELFDLGDVDPDVSVNRNYVNAELGYAFLELLAIRVTVHYQNTMGGVAYLETLCTDPDECGGFQPPDDPDVVRVRSFDHDALRKESFLLVGGGVSVTPFDGFVVSALYQHWVAGANTHDTSAFTLTVGYQFFGGAAGGDDINEALDKEYVNPFGDDAEGE